MAIATNPTEPLLTAESAEDAVLVARLAEGDGNALEVLYDRYSRVVYSFSLRMLADASSAEELTQEVFLRLWRQGGSYQQSRGAFLTWLLSVTHNMAIDEIRRRKRRPIAAETSDDDQTLTMLPDTRTDVEGAAWLTTLQAIVQLGVDRHERLVVGRGVLDHAFGHERQDRHIALEADRKDRLGDEAGIFVHVDLCR